MSTVIPVRGRNLIRIHNSHIVAGIQGHCWRTGMCIRVFMPTNYTRCHDFLTNPFCAGEGAKPYLDYMSADWAWGAKIKWSTEEKLYY